MRPRFQLLAPWTAAQVLDLFQQKLDEGPSPCTGNIVGKHIRITMEPPFRHYWTPHLELEVEPHEEGAMLRGLFGPHPSVWTMFTMFYAILAFGAFVALTFGMAQLTIGMTPFGIWSLPAFGVLALLVYIVALIGQRLAQEQMHTIRHFVEQTLRLE